MNGPWRLHRQVQLAEIGDAGQARIAARIAAVPAPEDGLGGRVASAYASRAGFAGLEVGPPEEAPPFVHHEAARAVVSGSLAALRELRAAVFGGAP